MYKESKTIFLWSTYVLKKKKHILVSDINKVCVRMIIFYYLCIIIAYTRRKCMRKSAFDFPQRCASEGSPHTHTQSLSCIMGFFPIRIGPVDLK